MEILYFLGVLTLLAVYNFVEKYNEFNKSIFWQQTCVNISQKDDHENVWENSGHFEGDIILNDAQKEILSQMTHDEGGPRNSFRDLSKKWPHNVVVYNIKSEDFSTAHMKMIYLAFLTVSKVSCVRFRQSSSKDKNVLSIVGRPIGCLGTIGFQSGVQIMNLDPQFPPGEGCFVLSSILHELLHALGFFHMHSNSNRDEYIKVQWDNIIPNRRPMFSKLSNKLITDFGVEYDYKSIMHYSSKAFSINNKDTIIPLKKGAVIQSAVNISELDIKKINLFYCN